MVLKAIIFDFDGVITESLDLKAKAFAYLFRDFPQEIIQKVVKLHLDNGGMSRYEKFKIAYEEFLGLEYTKKIEDKLAGEFGEYCFREMINCPYVEGVIEFLEKNYQKYFCFVVSGTPHGEMNDIVDARNLRKYFKEVLGIPGSKADLSKQILKNYDLKPEEAVLIGDSPTDYRGAEGADLHFIARIAEGKYNPFEPDNFKIKYEINDLTELSNILDQLEAELAN